MTTGQEVRIETSATKGKVMIDIYLPDGEVLSIGHDAESTRQLARTLEMAAEVAETGEPLVNEETTKTERLAIEMCARWIELRASVSRNVAIVRAHEKIMSENPRVRTA